MAGQLFSLGVVSRYCLEFISDQEEKPYIGTCDLRILVRIVQSTFFHSERFLSQVFIINRP